MRFVKPYAFSQIDFDPSKSKAEMLRVAKLHVGVYSKKYSSDTVISADVLKLAYEK